MEQEDRRETRKMREIKAIKNSFLSIFMVIFLIIFLISGGALLRYYINYRQAENQKDEMVALHESLKATAASDAEAGEGEGGNGAGKDTETSAKENEVVYEEMKKINPDYTGWISIEETGINYPVVYRDNSYYLKHNFKGEKDSHGTIFLDEDCTIDDNFLLLHGHHMKDGTMFGELKQYNKADFRENHRQINLELQQGDEHYLVFAVMRIDLTREEHFPFYELPRTEEEAEQYLNQVRAQSLWYQDTEYDWNNSRVLLLSTCEYGTADERLVIAAIAQ